VEKWREVLNQLVAIFVAALLAWATWLTTENTANKVVHANMITKAEARQIKEDAVTATQNQLEELIHTVRAMDDKLDTVAERQAAILADLEHVKNALK